ARRKVQKLRTTVLDRLQQRRNRQMRFAHVEAEEAVIMAHGFDSGQCAPDIQRCAIRIAADRELDHMMPAQTLDEIRRRALRNDLAMIDNDQAIAETLGLIHVVSREQHGPAGALKTANNIPKLSATLRVESSGGLVKKKNLGIPHEGGRNRQSLALTAGELAHPCVRFFGELELFQNFAGQARLAIKAGEKNECLAHRKFFGEARLL